MDIPKIYCKNCNKETKKWGTIGKKYCNIICKQSYESRINKKVFANTNCIVCGVSFLPKSVVNTCCSHLCKSKHETQKRSKKTKFKICSFCSTQFTPYTSLDKFCSAKCRIDNQKAKRSFNWSKEKASKRLGKNNPAYRHGLSSRGVKLDSTGIRLFHKNRNGYKQDLLIMYGYLFCEKCGISGKRFETHHIIYRSEKPNHKNLHDKINLIHLCVPCHNWFHKNKSNRNLLVQSRHLDKYFGQDVLDK